MSQIPYHYDEIIRIIELERKEKLIKDVEESIGQTEIKDV